MFGKHSKHLGRKKGPTGGVRASNRATPTSQSRYDRRRNRHYLKRSETPNA